jgi:hypothetical protein
MADTNGILPIRDTKPMGLPMTAPITPAIANAAGRDAGNRSMRTAGRTRWNETDWNAAAEVANMLLRMGGLIPAAE